MGTRRLGLRRLLGSVTGKAVTAARAGRIPLGALVFLDLLAAVWERYN